MPASLVSRLLSTVVLLSVLYVSPACAAPRGRVYVSVRPPAPIVAVRPPAPGPRHVWVDGYHHWNGRTYVWVAGTWMVPVRRGVTWIPGRWHHDRRGWYYVDGRWR